MADYLDISGYILDDPAAQSAVEGDIVRGGKIAHLDRKKGKVIVEWPKETVTQGTVTTKQIIEAWQTERTAWTVDDMVDFTTAEPSLALAGKRYLNTATGKGSSSKTLDFHNGDLYEVGSDGTWHEYMPKDSWALTHMEHTWTYFNGQWNLVPGIAHEHDRLIKGEFTFFIDDNGNFNKRKKAKAQAATMTPQAANMAGLDGTAAPVAAAADTTTETDKILHFSGSLIDWLPNEEIERGYLRRANFMVGNSERITNNFILVSNVDRTTNATFDLKEIVPQVASSEQTFNNYSIAAQLLSPNWLPGQLAMQGMRVKLFGFLGEYTGAKITNQHFDLEEQLEFGFVSTAAMGMGNVWHQVAHGLAVGQIVAKPADNLVAYQPGMRPCGYVRHVLSDNALIIDGNGWGIDPYNSDVDEFWNYDNGTELYASENGAFTDVKPAAFPYWSMGFIWDKGYFYCDMRERTATGNVAIQANAFKPLRYKVFASPPGDQLITTAGGEVTFNKLWTYDNERGYLQADLMATNRIICPDDGVVDINVSTWFNAPTNGGRANLIHYNKTGQINNTYVQLTATASIQAKSNATLSNVRVSAGDRFGMAAVYANTKIYAAEGHTEITISYKPNEALVGAKGEQGLPGKDGVQGIQGIQGLKGDPGAKGDNGLDGRNGSPGLNGLNGRDGLNGLDATAVRSALKPDFTQTWETWHEVVKDLAAWKVTARLWIRIDGDSAMPMAVRTMDMPDASHGGSELVSPGVYRATLKGGTTITYRTATTRGINDIDFIQFPANTYNDISWEILDANKAKVGNFGTANGGGSVNSFMTGWSQGFNPFPPGSAFIRYKLTKTAGGVTVFDAPIL